MKLTNFKLIFLILLLFVFLVGEVGEGLADDFVIKFTPNTASSIYEPINSSGKTLKKADGSTLNGWRIGYIGVSNNGVKTQYKVPFVWNIDSARTTIKIGSNNDGIYFLDTSTEQGDSYSPYFVLKSDSSKYANVAVDKRFELSASATFNDGESRRILSLNSFVPSELIENVGCVPIDIDSTGDELTISNKDIINYFVFDDFYGDGDNGMMFEDCTFSNKKFNMNFYKGWDAFDEAVELKIYVNLDNHSETVSSNTTLPDKYAGIVDFYSFSYMNNYYKFREQINKYYDVEICEPGSGGTCYPIDSTTNELQVEYNGIKYVIIGTSRMFRTSGPAKFEICAGEIRVDGTYFCYSDSETSCDDGYDNDGDGLIDCDDPDCEADDSFICCGNAGGIWDDDLGCCGDDKLTGGYENINVPSELGLEGPGATISSSNCLMGDKCLEVTPGTTTSFGIYKDIYDTLKTGISRYVLTGFLKSSSPSDQGSTRVRESGNPSYPHKYDYNNLPILTLSEGNHEIYIKTICKDKNGISFIEENACYNNLKLNVNDDNEKDNLVVTADTNECLNHENLKTTFTLEYAFPSDCNSQINTHYSIDKDYTQFVSDTEMIKDKWLLKTAVVPDRGHIGFYDQFRAYPIFFYQRDGLSSSTFYSDEAYLIPYSDMGKTNEEATTMCTYIQPDLTSQKTWEWTEATSSGTEFKIFPIGWTIDAISNGDNWYYCNADGRESSNGYDILNQGYWKDTDDDGVGDTWMGLLGPTPIAEYGTFESSETTLPEGKFYCHDYITGGDTNYLYDFTPGTFCDDCWYYFINELSGSIPSNCLDDGTGEPPCCSNDSCGDSSVCNLDWSGDETVGYWYCLENPSDCVGGEIIPLNDNCSILGGTLCNITDKTCAGGELVYSDDSGGTELCCLSPGVCTQQSDLTCIQQSGFVCDNTEGWYCGSKTYDSSDTQTENLECCAEPCKYYSAETENRYINESFICYNNNNRTLFAECTSGVLYNPERQLYSGGDHINKIYYDNSVFTTGSALQSIFTHDILTNNKLLDMVRVLTLDRYLTGSNNDKILLETDNYDWSGFDYLEFGVMFNRKNINISFVDENDKKVFNHNLIDFIVDKNTAIHSLVPHHVVIDLSETGIDFQTIKVSNIKFIQNDESANQVKLAIDKIKLTKINDANNKPINDYYCAGTFGKWISGLNPPDTTDLNNFEEFGPYMVACKSNFGFDWTGTKCCGYESSYGEPEYYNDTLMGCWGGTPVKNDQTVANATRSLSYYPNELFYDGGFGACIVQAGGTATQELNEPISEACTIQGSHFCSPEAKWKKTFEGTNLGVYYVDGTGALQTREISTKCVPPGFDYKQKIIQTPDETIKKVTINFNNCEPEDWSDDLSNSIPLNSVSEQGTEQGCCPDDYCWDGTSCVSYEEYLDADVPPIWWTDEEIGYRCTLNTEGIASWELSYKKESYNEQDYGWCPGDTCLIYVGASQVYGSEVKSDCMNPNEYIGDYYCLGDKTGNWTRRTFIIAEELLNLTTKGQYKGKDYSIYCGDYGDALNDISFTDTLMYDSSNCKINVIDKDNCINKLCVLNTETNTILATSLNTNYSNNFEYVLDNYRINASCEGKENYEACELYSYGDKPSNDKYKIYYDNITKIIFVSEDTITLNPNWLQTFWKTLINLFKTKNPEVTNFKYENFYHIQEGEKAIHAIYKEKTGHTDSYILINYTGFNQSTLNLICEKVNYEVYGGVCVNHTNYAIVNTTAPGLENEWIELTSKTRIQEWIESGNGI